MGLRVILLALSLAAAGCAPVSQPPAGAASADLPLPSGSAQAHMLMPNGSAWDVLILNGMGLNAGQATIRVAGDSVSFKGCNAAGGLVFAPLGLPGDPQGGISTLIGCEEPGMRLDAALYQAVGQARNISRGAQPGTVQVIGGGQQLMILRRRPAGS